MPFESSLLDKESGYKARRSLFNFITGNYIIDYYWCDMCHELSKNVKVNWKPFEHKRFDITYWCDCGIYHALEIIPPKKFLFLNLERARGVKKVYTGTS